MELRKYEKVLTLNFLEKFKCDSCTLCCTNKWNIDLTAAEYVKTKEKVETLGKQIEEYVDINLNENRFKTKFKGKNCAFLQEDKMCLLQNKFGWETLSDTCRTFPRRMILTPRGLEIGFTLACPSLVSNFFKKEPAAIVANKKEDFNYMPGSKFEFIEPRNAMPGTFHSNYFIFEEKAIELFNDTSKNVGELLKEFLILFNQFYNLRTKIVDGKNLNVRESIEFLNQIMLCSPQSEFFTLEKTNIDLKPYLSQEKLAEFSRSELLLTDELLVDILSHWDKEDDMFLRKYSQNYIFKKSLFMNGKREIFNLIYHLTIVKFYLALNAKKMNRKLNLAEKTQLIVGLSSPLNHNKILENDINKMLEIRYRYKPDEVIQTLSNFLNNN